MVNCLGEKSMPCSLELSPHTVLFARHESQVSPRNSFRSKLIKPTCRWMADWIAKTQKQYSEEVGSSVWQTSASDQL